MKVQIREYAGCTSIDLTAETVEDSAKLTRLKINSTKELRGVHVDAYMAGSFEGNVVIAKRKSTQSSIPTP